jgi:hypothetical protein
VTNISTQSDAEIEQHDHAEMHRADAEILHHREKDRRRDQDRRRWTVIDGPPIGLRN